MIVINQDVNNVSIVASQLELNIIKEILEYYSSREKEDWAPVVAALKRGGYTFDELDALSVSQQFALTLKTVLARYNVPPEPTADPDDLPSTASNPNKWKQ